MTSGRPLVRFMTAVDVAVDVAVERAGRSGAHRAADDRREHEPQVREAALARGSSTGAVVTSSSSMTRGLVRAMYAADLAAAPVDLPVALAVSYG